MSFSTIEAHVDEMDKARFNAFCSDVGLNPSSALNLFIKAVIRENRIPFSISRDSDPFYDEVNQAHVLKSLQELKDGKGTSHELIEVGDD